MNPIIEEAMTNMIRRIDRLEESIKYFKKNFNQKPTKENFNSNLASKAQTDYLRSLGGKTHEGMTKQEAGEGIDNCLLNKKITEEVIEPEEVDTDDAGLDSEDLM